MMSWPKVRDKVQNKGHPMTTRADDTGLFRRLVPRQGAVIAFTIDGESVEGREGDLLLTAILLHRPSLRRFEFGCGHRAGFCLMAACQDCWVGLADGRRVRACSAPLEPGMAVVIDGGPR